MKAYLINMHLLVPRSRSFAKVNDKYIGYISQKMSVSGAFVFHKNIFFFQRAHFFDRIPWQMPHQRCQSAGGLTFSQTSPCLLCKSFENSEGKGEIVRHEQFLFFPQFFFYTLSENFTPLSSTSDSSSANSLSLVESKICRLGKD